MTTKGAVYVSKGVERQRGHVMSVSDVRCFGYGGACRYDGNCSGIGRGDDPCCREGFVDSGGEGDTEVYERAAAEVCVEQRRIRVEELVHGVDHGICRLAVDWWDGGVFEALNDLIGGGGRRGEGGKN